MTDKDSYFESIRKEFDAGMEESVENTENSNGSYEGTPFYERTHPVFAWLIVGAAFLTGGLFAAANVSAGQWVWFLIVGSIVSFPFWAILTEPGLKWLNNLQTDKKDSGNSQTVTVGESPQHNVICSTCGWKNPRDNNYCHDCGSELSSQS